MGHSSDVDGTGRVKSTQQSVEGDAKIVAGAVVQGMWRVAGGLYVLHATSHILPALILHYGRVK